MLASVTVTVPSFLDVRRACSWSKTGPLRFSALSAIDRVAICVSLNAAEFDPADIKSGKSTTETPVTASV